MEEVPRSVLLSSRASGTTAKNQPAAGVRRSLAWRAASDEAPSSDPKAAGLIREDARRAAYLLLAALALLASSCATASKGANPTASEVSPWSSWCTLDGKRVHYLDARSPESGSTLVILHGYLGSTRPFVDLVVALSHEVGVVVPDLPGFGDSEAPAGVCSRELYLQFLDDFLELLGPQPLYLVGSSLGADIAVHYAVRNPQRVRGLVLVSPFGLPDQGGHESRVHRWQALFPLAVRLVTKKTVERRLRGLICVDDRITPELIDARWKPFTSREGRRVVVEITREIIGRSSMDQYLPSIEKPVLILIGSEDSLLGPEERLELLHLLADVRMLVVEGCGHLLHLDSPSIVAEEIVRFIKEVPDEQAIVSRTGHRLDLGQHRGD